MSKTKIYVAGPMSGLPEFNHQSFYRAQDLLESLGYKVFNPAANDEDNGVKFEGKSGKETLDDLKLDFNLRDAFRWDTARILDSDAIYMLKGWENSSGARAEHALATTLGLEIYYESCLI